MENQLKNDLINACTNNRFPKLQTMSHFGLNGNTSASPLDILRCYRIVCNLGCDVTPQKINETFESYINYDYKPYQRVRDHGGVKITSSTLRECPHCFYNGVNPGCCNSTSQINN